jgi:hypothetical protein
MSRGVGRDVRKRSEWLARLRRFNRSKLSVIQFCRREEVSVPSYYQWRRKLADAISELDAGEQPATFIPVQVASSAEVQVSFPNGARLTLPAQDHELVRMSIESIALTRTFQGGA